MEFYLDMQRYFVGCMGGIEHIGNNLCHHGATYRLGKRSAEASSTNTLDIVGMVESMCGISELVKQLLAIASRENRYGYWPISSGSIISIAHI